MGDAILPKLQPSLTQALGACVSRQSVTSYSSLSPIVVLPISLLFPGKEDGPAANIALMLVQ